MNDIGNVAGQSSASSSSHVPIQQPAADSLLIRIKNGASSLFGDIGIGLAAGPLFLFANIKSNFDPSPDLIKRDKTPVLLLHGSSSNELQWVIGRYFFLNQDEFGSVFTLNMDGIVTSQVENGCDDYAVKVAKKVQEIGRLIGRNDIDLIGHSLGVLTAAYFAENIAINENVRVRKIISIAAPWHGSPLLEKVTNLFPWRYKNPKRYRQMRNESNFLDKLRAQVQRSDQTTLYYCIWSRADNMVPDDCGKLELPPERQRMYTDLGHYAPMVSFDVWKQIQKWLKE